MDTEVYYDDTAKADIKHIEEQLLQFQYGSPLYKKLVNVLEALQKLPGRAHMFPIDTQNPKYRKWSIGGYVILYVYQDNESPQGSVAKVVRIIPSNWDRTNETRHAMRRWMTLAITLNEAAEQAIPRLWLGPKGEVIDVAHEDVSHSKYVIDHPQTFGLTADMLVAAMSAEEVDFDWIIAKAESNGWVRTSGDLSFSQPHMAAVSASNAQNIRRGVRFLQQHGLEIDSLQVEIETIVGNEVDQRFFTVEGEAFVRFVERGILPR